MSQPLTGHYKTLIESDFLGQWDLPKGRDVTVKIAGVFRYNPEKKQKKLNKETGQYEDEKNKRIKITFHGKKKAWLAGPVSQKALAGMFGPNVERWVDQTITLYVDPNVKMGRDVVGGIRVRPERPHRDVKPDEDPLDNPVDKEKRETIDRALERTSSDETKGANNGDREPGED